MSINVTNLTVTKSNRNLISDISFTAEAGELIGIIGENGAGKSTLLNALSGLEPSENSVQINQTRLEDYTLEDLSEHRAVLPQNNDLVFPFQAREVVGLGLSLTSLSLEQQSVIVEQCLKEVDAAHFSHKSYLLLSGGERQRIQLARVLAQLYASDVSEKYLFLDEPTSALDLKHKFSIFKQLKRLTKKGIGVLVIIHDLNLASMFCDKILLLSQGELVGFEEPGKILRAESIKQYFDANVVILKHPQTSSPLVVSQLDNLSN
jgi:iron complex transport system ATP-binding protein